MDPNWAAQNLQVIRTLMERSAIYRRALAPIMLFLGTLAFLSGFAGFWLQFDTSQSFVLFWISVGIVGLFGAFYMARRQAFREKDAFWSPPTRRVAQALIPPLFLGFVIALAVLLIRPGNPRLIWWLPPLWMALYGCGIHAAGFFMKRGMKLFGWLFLGIGTAVTLWLALTAGNELQSPLRQAHLLMGGIFGGCHLAYGAYLFFTETGKNET